MNLKGRLEKLEAVVPNSTEMRCLVVHNENCADARDEAIAAYRATHGHDPVDFINILLVSPETKQSVCGCTLDNSR